MTHYNILKLHTLSPLSAGTGNGCGGIDLPIQREQHTGHPTVYGSGVKGVLRDVIRGDRDNNCGEIQSLFGPSADGIDDKLGMGSLCISDARLAFFPIRSLKGLFTYATSPYLLERMKRDILLADPQHCIKQTRMPTIENGQVAVADTSVLTQGETVILEDSDFTCIDNSQHLDPYLIEALCKTWSGKNALPSKDFFEKHISIISDEDLAWFTTNSCQVQTRIAIDPETKVVKGSALFTQESVPADAIFYSLIGFDTPRVAKGSFNSEEKACDYFEQQLPSCIQLGGSATIGHGMCASTLLTSPTQGAE